MNTNYSIQALLEPLVSNGGSRAVSNNHLVVAHCGPAGVFVRTVSGGFYALTHDGQLTTINKPAASPLAGASR